MKIHDALTLAISWLPQIADWEDAAGSPEAPGLNAAADALTRLRDALPTLDALYGAADAARVQDPQHEGLWNQVELLALALEFPNA